MQASSVTRRVIVIGASSGGVEALRLLVNGLPADLPAAVFIVLHLSRTARSRLAEVLARETALPVSFARDGDPIVPGEIRIAPPDLHLTLDRTSMHLDNGPLENRVRPAIDVLFRSTAISQGPAAVGIVLTGSLGDGSVGLATIKRCGGFAIVQHPDDASFPSMPRSAVEADHPDAVVPLGEIVGQVMGALQTPGVATPVPDAIAREADRRVPLGLASQRHNDALGERAALTCTDCGGPLWQVHGGPAGYRCQIGHAYDSTVLLDAKTEQAVRALWVAVRTLDERARLLAELAKSNHEAGRARAAVSYTLRHDELRDAARVVEELIPRRAAAPEGNAP